MLLDALIARDIVVLLPANTQRDNDAADGAARKLHG